jgi:hypothetical protein
VDVGLFQTKANTATNDLLLNLAFAKNLEVGVLTSYATWAEPRF